MPVANRHGRIPLRRGAKNNGSKHLVYLVFGATLITFLLVTGITSPEIIGLKNNSLAPLSFIVGIISYLVMVVVFNRALKAMGLHEEHSDQALVAVARMVFPDRKETKSVRKRWRLEQATVV